MSETERMNYWWRRAKAAEAKLDSVAKLADEWATQPTDYDEDTEQQIEDGRTVLAIIKPAKPSEGEL